ncbi:MAG: RdgB/HAM1 family non-canonical purine NTP pyrophosphatase [Polyangiaceae bacterium]|nr:RdgB/HAM1 family non-canonical purine NTP pyrophosphatase [Polyangiaceae bacterium]
MARPLVIATQNRGKLEEFRALLSGLDIEVLGLRDVIQHEFSVVEDGDTFEQNAIKKARAVAEATMMLTLADDSGLEVDALGGAPGVRSARFAGEHATDNENNAALLSALGRIADDATSYGARFRCVLALIDPFVNGGAPVIVDGVCEGHIIRSARGSRGFGYDPLFVVEGGDRTMAELSDDEKNHVSHRARALAKLRLMIAERVAITRHVHG